MAVALVQRTDALLEGQKALVDLGAFHPGLPVGVQRVCSALAPCQVNEGELAMDLVCFCDLHTDLEYGVGPGGVLVGTRLARGPHAVAKLDQVQHLVAVLHPVLRQPNDTHCLLAILTRQQLLPLIQQVIQFPGIDLKEADHNLLVRLKSFVDVLGCHDVHPKGFVAFAHHRVRLATASLAVCEARRRPPVEYSIHQRLGGTLINLLVGGEFIKDLIKHECVLLRVPCQVHFHLGFQDGQVGGGARVDGAHVRLRLCSLLCVQRSLAHSYTDSGRGDFLHILF
mmetsp:Transcript_34838/g.62273  ORF Transcript_34838/g.62273 Transcript_34838/m.62273 type:complete len:283 (-) Transcript_34838:434-1282(-)